MTESKLKSKELDEFFDAILMLKIRKNAINFLKMLVLQENFNQFHKDCK